MSPEKSPLKEKRIQIGVQVFIIKNSCLLMGLRKNCFAAGTWGLPGGRLKFGEEIEEAALRELHEETGIEADGIEIFGVCNNAFPAGNHHLQIGLIAHINSEKPEIKEPDYCEEWSFFSLDSLPDNINPATVGLLEQFRKK